MSENPFDLTKINAESDELTKSQLARVMLENQVYTDLMKFLQSHIQVITARNSIKAEAENLLMKRFGDAERPLSDQNLIRIIEIFNKDETDKAAGILNVLQKTANITINNQPPGDSSNPGGPKKIKEPELTQEELHGAKELLKWLKDLEKSEFNKDEIKEAEITK